MIFLHPLMKNKTIHYKRPFLFRLINSLGNSFNSYAKINAVKILDSARNAAGSTDVGTDSFIENMKVLIDSCKREAEMNLIGRITLHRTCVQAIRDRLIIQSHLKKEPGILKTEINKPIFVLGMARTGTTLLQNLIACDPNIRPLYYWEQAQIGIPPAPEIVHNNPILNRAQKDVARLRWLAPDFMAAHEVNPRGVEECNELMNREFISILHFMFRNVPTYMEWVLSINMSNMYNYHKLQLQYLGYNFPGKRWMLKAQAHLAFLADLFNIYPDAIILHLHRDPVHSVPSMCSLASISRSLLSDKTDLTVIPKQWSDLMQNIINRSIEQRSNFNEDQFFDIPYNHLVNNPLETVEWIYKRIGMECSGEFKIGMNSWLEKSKTRRNKNPHHNTMDQFGFDEKSIQKKFSNYYDRYGEFINAN